MKKISSKIIVYLLLTIFLWTGVGTFGIHTVHAGAGQVAGWIVESAQDLVMGINGAILQLLAIPIVSLLLRIMAAILDMSIKFTLSTEIFKSSGLGVTTIWAMVRDVCNVTFIFILLWTAIQTIIGVAGAKTKEVIAHVVVAALLINFSLFLTRLVIDFGNMFGVSLYNQIMSVDPTGTVGLSGILMSKLGITWNGSTEASAAGGIISTEYGITSFLQLVTVLTAFLVFLYAMLLMITRSVILIFLIAISPIGFMGDVIPKFKEYSETWRTTLYGQVMIAPIFLLFLYLIIKVGGSFNATTGVVDGVPLGDADTLKYLAYFKYVMIIMLLIISVKVTKKMTGPIGAAIEKIGMLAVGAAVGVASGGAALALRQTAGRFSANQLEGEKGAALRARAASGDRGAKIKLAMLEKGKNSSFDARNAPGVGLASKAYGMVGSQIGVKVPTAGTPGQAFKAASAIPFVGTTLGRLGGTTTEIKAAEQEAENKRYNDLNAGVTNKQKLDANQALQKRDVEVKTRMEADAAMIGPDGFKTKKDNLLNVTVQMPTNTEWQKVKDDHAEAVRLQGMAVGAKDIAEATRSANAAERTMKAKEKELQEELKKKYAGELAELDEEIKTIKNRTEVAVENDTAIITPDEKKKLDIINQARNYAASVRAGRFGHGSLSGQVRRNELANKMENQREVKIK